MKRTVIFICVCVFVEYVNSHRYHNDTYRLDAASQQLPEFRLLHPKPVGVFTKVSGEPLDIRDVTTLNTDIFNHRNHFRFTSHHLRERIPERVVHAKGVGAFGYFEVTNDVSKYIKSDVFNGIGHKTPVFVRFSTEVQNLGGTDLIREAKGMAVKMYTKQGNLDLLCINFPIFAIKDPMVFSDYVHAFKRNPRTDMVDETAKWDFMNLHSDVLHSVLYLASDLGFPDGYRKMNGFAVHTYEIYNKHGQQFYVKFNFKTETGLFNMSDARAQALAFENPDYFYSDLYNAIAEKNYPAWRLEMDIMTQNDLLKIDYDPFDLTRVWKQGTYRRVIIGRLVLNRRVENHFKDTDQSAFAADNLVPGIKGPFDAIFRARKIANPSSQNYRLGANYDNIRVNAPLYKNVYNRDGKAPLLDNMRDAPNYFPNSFNGPMPYVEEARGTENKMVYHRNAVDLQPMSEFYNMIDSDAHRKRLANVLAASLKSVTWDIKRQSLRILTLIDEDLGKRVRKSLAEIKAETTEEKRARVAQCVADVNRNLLNWSRNHYHYKLRD